MPATTAAQAPVPQASVSPAPRSNTRRRMRAARDDLHEAGVDALRRSARASRSAAPASRPARRRRRRRSAPRAGCPSTAARPRRVRPSPSSSGQSGRPPSVARGAIQVVSKRHRAPDRNRAGPCRPSRRPSAARRSTRRRFMVSTRERRLVAQALVAHVADEAARAVAAVLDLVAAAAVEDAVAEVDLGRSAPSRPPGSGRRRRRSAGRRGAFICAASSASGARVASSTTKSLPAPCILVKRTRIRRLSMPVGRGSKRARERDGGAAKA